MKRRISFRCSFGILLLGVVLPLFGQGENAKARYQINGQIVEAKSNKSLPFVTLDVVLESDTNKVIRRAASDGDGRFILSMAEKGAYRLRITYMGFEPINQKLRLDNQTRIELGQIKMQEGLILNEVQVIAMKPLVKSDIDKITYSVADDPEAQSNNLMEMLRKVPFITIDGEENIELKGQKNFKVLMNGKESSMLSGNLKDILKSIPAHTIKSIEVITNPSSKYDAEGIGGLINIVTTKEGIKGMTGSVGASIDSHSSLGGNIYLMGTVKKLTLSAQYAYNQHNQPTIESTGSRTNFLSDEYRYYNTASKIDSKNEGQNFALEGSYEIDSLNLISLNVSGYRGDYSINSRGTNEERSIDQELTRAFALESNSSNNYTYIAGGIDYQKTFAKPDRTLTTSYRFSINDMGSTTNNNYTSALNFTPYRQRSINDAAGSEHTVQVDYYDPLSKMHQIEGGLKYIMRINNSSPETYLWDDATHDWIYQAERVNNLNYDQHIIGLYGGYLFKTTKFSTKIGARLEGTMNRGEFEFALLRPSTQIKDSITQSPLITNNFNLVPYIMLAYDLTPERKIKGGYTQRLSRPGIWYLNPYVNDSDPYNIHYGNPELKSEVSHSFSLDYSEFKPKYNYYVGLNGLLQNNGIQAYSTIEADGMRRTTYANVGENQSYSLDANGGYRPTSKLSINANAAVRYQKIQSAINGRRLNNEGFRYEIGAFLRFVPYKGASINANGGYGSPRIGLQNISAYYYYYSLSFTQKFFKERWDASLSMNTLFPKHRVYRDEGFDNRENPTYNYVNEMSYVQQRIRLSISYRFGTMKNGEVKRARRGVNNDDIKSGGDGASSQAGGR